MTMFLVEAQKTRDSKFEPIDVVTSDDAKSAMNEADLCHAMTTHCRRVRPVGGNLLSLVEKGFNVCVGGATCEHGSNRPHLTKIPDDFAEKSGVKQVIDEMKKR